MKRITIASTLIASMLFTSCKKYEDGPVISLLTRKARIANEWVIEKAIDEKGNDVTSYWQGANPLLSIKKDKTYSAITAFGVVLSGTWDFSNKGEDVVLSQSSPYDNITTYTILRLTSKELWVKETDSTPAELHYKQK